MQQLNNIAKKILFLSSANLSTNPRILKEIQLAGELGYDVTFVGFRLGDWSDEMDAKLVAKFTFVSNTYLSAIRRPFLPWVISSIIEQICRITYRVFKNNLKISAFASSKRAFLLDNFLNRRVKYEFYDLIVAHTLPTLYPAYNFARKTKTKFIFDLEDFHPGETVKKDVINEKSRRLFLLKKILPSCCRITCASPLITTELKKLLPNNSNAITINNFFLEGEFRKPLVIRREKLELIWFSQNINYGRGLEIILPVWNELKEFFNLTLVGKIDEKFYNKYLQKSPDIIIKTPVSQLDLHSELSEYDIGLAIDVDDQDYNRKIALTNKILAYFQAGLYIIATNTPAQMNFIEQHSFHGTIVKQSSDEIKRLLLKLYFNKKNIIRELKIERYKLASQYSWNKESKKIISIWRNC